MRAARFILTDRGLFLETPVPLTRRQREAAATFALAVNIGRRAGLPPGDRRDAVDRTIRALRAGDFTERPVPRFDSSREVVLHG
jgi:hypothetical protein